MASILTDLLDESLLNAQKLEENGYKHHKKLQFFEKQIYHYTDNLNRNVHGIRKAYLTARVHFWDDCKKVRIDCKLIYITASHNQRYINCGSVRTVKDLFDKEFWALTTIEKINDDYENGKYNWPDYEYIRNRKYDINDIF